MSDVISALIPTRGRPGLLAAAVRLLLAQAARPGRVEILIYADDDDSIDYEGEVWAKFAARGEPRVRGQVLRGARRGYVGLFHYYNELAAAASGRWLMLLNDDSFMATKFWDRVLDGTVGDVAVAATESNHGRSPCTMPIFTKSFVDIIGHVSLQAHNDTWIEEVGKGAGITVDVPILLLHALIDDETAKEGKGDGRINQTSAEFYSPEMAVARLEDARKIRNYLASHPRAPRMVP